ncbi:MAG: hypothetical protein AAF790_01155 [Planctomycetota bacterium]
MIDYEVQRCTRRCAMTSRALTPGEVFYSVLRSRTGGVERVDYSAEAWVQLGCGEDAAGGGARGAAQGMEPQDGRTPHSEVHPGPKPAADTAENTDTDAQRDRQPLGASIAWWKSRMPLGRAGGAKLAPNEVMLQLFDRWADEPGREASRYVLALLLVRRRVFRFGDTQAGLSPGHNRQDQSDADLLRLECPTRGEVYETPVATPDAEQMASVQAELNQLLFADAA